ncbi:MAG: HD domain-containing protein [Oscillatoriaceae bacterium SKW80]|nr:HD domain-containing protein [Oscillatoriaceae bacterium SKYG93]MCX8122336.1 HD domain-containing protein [Oscillatoriaceae bacterium SKW80]MDW8452444.1 HD domain-containing phosphohydrolase [Oscillatoriaceae cyanobacterium SKYGB_i_bin93]HIK27722.1 HD domain-containing protein [Oscillatoriaceae cyanobacterium M7585_C2015_266]
MILDKQELQRQAAERMELIEQLLEIGAALSSSYDLGELLNLILTKSREITCSDAGSVYLVDNSDGLPKLLFKAAQNASRPNVSFREFAIPITCKSLAGYVALTGKSLNLPDAYKIPPGVPYQLDRSFDRDIEYRTRSILVLPMQNRQGEIIGVLQLINRKIRADVKVTRENVQEVTQPYSEWEERIIRSLASQVAISLERNQLQESIEQLFEGFVKAAVQVIEARDPCTSGHSERVATITVRLSEEVNTVNYGRLRNIKFSERQIQEIRYAALLHDFGKVGVPEAILVKQKKLYPAQIEVIRHRFALAQRTLEMEYAQAKFQHLFKHRIAHSETETDCPFCKDLEKLDTELSKKIEQLNKYWQLLLEANEPRILAEEPLAQLKELSNYTYRDIDGQLKPLVSPEEMAQLMVTKGNLTDEERLAIEAHVTHTYEFLKRIPWTKDLQDVPIIAYGHHEKLDGSGYPRGLKQDEIPVQAQIMAIADIYDALTAGDRPYKQGLPVAVALQILRQEAAQNKINPDFLELFEQRQVFCAIGHTLDL